MWKFRRRSGLVIQSDGPFFELKVESENSKVKLKQRAQSSKPKFKTQNGNMREAMKFDMKTLKFGKWSLSLVIKIFESSPIPESTFDCSTPEAAVC
jgi:hypothetical protein